MNECAIHTPAYASFTNLLLVCLHANKTHMGAYECVCVHTSCIHKCVCVCVCVCVCACACVYITYYIHHLHTSLHIHAFTYTHILCTRTNTQVCVQQQVDIPTLMHAYNHDARATRRCVTQHKKKVHPAMPPTVESTRSNASYCYYCCVSLCVRACACVRACVCVCEFVCVRVWQYHYNHEGAACAGFSPVGALSSRFSRRILAGLPTTRLAESRVRWFSQPIVDINKRAPLRLQPGYWGAADLASERRTAPAIQE